MILVTFDVKLLRRYIEYNLEILIYNYTALHLSLGVNNLFNCENKFVFWYSNERSAIIKNDTCRGFPGGAVVENPPASAGDTGSSPGLGRSHMLWSNWAREPQILSLCVWSLCSATREAVIVRGLRTMMKSGPRSPQLEKALTQKRSPNTAKKKKKKTHVNGTLHYSESKPINFFSLYSKLHLTY